MPFSRPIRSVTNCPSTTSDGRCGSDWTSAGRVRWPTAQTELAAFPTQHRRGGALMLGEPPVHIYVTYKPGVLNSHLVVFWATLIALNQRHILTLPCRSGKLTIHLIQLAPPLPAFLTEMTPYLIFDSNQLNFFIFVSHKLTFCSSVVSSLPLRPKYVSF